jgi:hypothetical protein
MEDTANPKETSNYSARNLSHGDRAKIKDFNFAAFFDVWTMAFGICAAITQSPHGGGQ